MNVKMGSSGRDSGDLLTPPMMGCGKSARGRESITRASRRDPYERRDKLSSFSAHTWGTGCSNLVFLVIDFS